MERQDQQISSIRRVTDRFNLEEEVMGLKWVMMAGQERFSLTSLLQTRDRQPQGEGQYSNGVLKAAEDRPEHGRV